MSKIVFTKIYKHFGKRQILNGVKLNLCSGECQLLSGPNGAGKTTLLRIISGLEKPDQCAVDIGFGTQSWKHYRHTLQNEIVYLHQQPYMFDGDVLHNLGYALPRHITKNERKQRINEALQWAGLEDIAKNQAKTLSGGERQRVAIARAWLRKPTVMLLDEPTANMDSDARQRTLKLLCSLKEKDIALLIASHDLNHFYSIADECLTLHQGHIEVMNKFGSPPDNITPLHKIQQAIL